VMQYDPNWAFLGVKTLREHAATPQGLAFDGSRFYVAYTQRTDGFPFTENIHLAAFDMDWNLIEDIALTDFSEQDQTSSIHPWLVLRDNRLYVSYCQNSPAGGIETLQAYVKVYELNPAATSEDAPSPLAPNPPPGTASLTSEKIIYYYFADITKETPPEGSVVIMPEVYILAPAISDMEYGPYTASDLRAALQAALMDGRNGWTSINLKIIEVTYDHGHANVVLQGEYYGVGDVTLIAARMQILMTVFSNPSIQTATVTLNGDTIGNLGASNDMDAMPADHVFTRSEIETFMNENAFGSP